MGKNTVTIFGFAFNKWWQTPYIRKKFTGRQTAKWSSFRQYCHGWNKLTPSYGHSAQQLGLFAGSLLGIPCFSDCAGTTRTV